MLNEYDVVIVGSGPIGVAMALKFANTRLKVAIVLGENEQYREELKKLNDSLKGAHESIDQSRYLGKGGTGNLWGGRLVNLDTIDFEPRPNLFLPNWPFSYNEYSKYVSEAYNFFGVNLDFVKEKPSPKKEEELDTSTFEVWTKFRNMFTAYQKELRRAKNIVIFENEILTKIDSTATGFKIKLSRNPTSSQDIYSKKLILCCGTIENNRIILNFADKNKEIFSKLSNIGENYSAHLMLHFNSIQTLSEEWQMKRVAGVRYRARIRLDEEFQIEHGILNAAGFFAFDSRSPLSYIYRKPHVSLTRLIKNHGLDLPRFIWNHKQDLLNARKTSYEVENKEIFHLQTEIAPNPSSKIELLDIPDGWGNYLVQPSLKFMKIDFDTVRLTMNKISEILGLKVHIDSINVEIESQLQQINLNPHSHHQLGGLIMGTSDENSVTNQFGSVHNLPNLYCLGGSMFPRAGQANSTLPMVAIAIRTANHILSEFN
jgi:choline dehydrogenase-like flavoprotein